MIFIKEYEIFEINSSNVLVNYLNGACDIIDNNLKANILSGNTESISTSLKGLLVERGYIHRTHYEYDNFLSKLNQKLDYDDFSVPPNFLIIPSYECNLKCSYCFESAYKISSKYSNKPKKWDSAFNFIDYVVAKFDSENEGTKYDPKQVIITLMGGEPLLEENHSTLENIIDKIVHRGFSYNIITNGVNIPIYLDLFKKLKPISIQVTLDGTSKIHDSRRIKKDGEGSFDEIITGIKMLIDNKITVYIRMNVDQDNVSNIQDFEFFFNAEFNNSPYCIPYLYPIQDGGCIYEQNILDEKSIIKVINNIHKEQHKSPEVRCIFHGSNLIDSILSNSRLKLKYRNCAANRRQYILDSTGMVYKCWYGVGNPEFSIGKYTETNTYGNIKDNLWRARNINKIKQCNDCKYRYICGGGCLSHVYTEDKDILKARCVDYHSLLKLQLEKMLTEMEYSNVYKK